jgi:autotransporter-associated beta strand protein
MNTIDMPEWPTIGKNNYFHPTVVIGPNVTIGDNNYFGPYCVIGFPAEHRSYWDKSAGHVVIGNNNKFTGLVTIDAGTETDTIIFNNCWFLKHSHVGHDAIIHDNVTISCGAKIGGHATILANSNIGLNACIHQWVSVPEGCMVGMNAAVTKKLKMEPYRKYAGVPASDIGSNQKLTSEDKVYINDLKDEACQGDTIYFEMPPFCSGEYSARVEKDENGLYILKKDNFFLGCRSYSIHK